MDAFLFSKVRAAFYGLLFLLMGGVQAFASGSYDFTVTRNSDIKNEVLHARFKYGDIDPGKDVAKVIVSQRLKDANTRFVEVSDYNPALAYTSTDVPEFTVNFTAEQVGQIATAAGRGDLAGVAVLTTGVVVGVGTDVVKGAGKAAEDTKDFVNRTFGLHL